MKGNGDKPSGKQSSKSHTKRKNISVRPTPEQLDALHERASSFGYKSVSQYLIERGLKDGVMIQSPQRERLERLLFEVRKVGININHIAHGMKTGDKGYSQQQLDRAMREVTRVMKDIGQEFKG